MTLATQLVDYLDTELRISEFRDYGPNGLQVEGPSAVTRVVTGVSANAALIDAAAELKAQLIVVHHGIIWGSGLQRVTGVTGRRLASLHRAQIGLAAYHLPLDEHERLGNNVGLCDALGLLGDRTRFGNVRGHEIGMMGELSEDVSVDDANQLISRAIGGKAPKFAFWHGPKVIRRVGVCSGAASDILEEAHEQGCDLFITGELAERAEGVAKELGIHLVAAGHYDTEVFGPQRIAKELSRMFPNVATSFVDIPCSL